MNSAISAIGALRVPSEAPRLLPEAHRLPPEVLEPPLEALGAPSRALAPLLKALASLPKALGALPEALVALLKAVGALPRALVSLSEALTPLLDMWREVWQKSLCIKRKEVYAAFSPMSGVLVIEDDKALCRLLELMLKRDGLTAEVVQRGDDAVAAIERDGDQYDAILLDMMLPGMSGAEILTRLRVSRPHLLDRILVISAAPTHVLQAVEKDGDVRGVFRKPFDLDTVITTLRECVRDTAAHGH